jgi:TatD DNase family protein
VILHCREQGDAEGGPCAEDLLSILSDWSRERSAMSWNPGVLHSFSGSLADARSAIEMGFCIGVTGPITYKNADSRRQTVAALPLEHLLIETDAPYLAPQPHRGKRNEPAYVAHIADKIAAILSISLQEVVAVTAQNAARLFSWGETA